MFGSIDWKKIGKGAAIALGGAALSYAATFVVPAVAASGPTGAMVAAVASILINAGLKALDGKVE